MHFGEGGICWGTSDGLIHWTPGASDDEPMYLPTPGAFDEVMVEIGTSPVLTDSGLLVMLTHGATQPVHAGGTVEVDYRCGQAVTTLAVAVADPAEPYGVGLRKTEPGVRIAPTITALSTVTPAE